MYVEKILSDITYGNHHSKAAACDYI